MQSEEPITSGTKITSSFHKLRDEIKHHLENTNLNTWTPGQLEYFFTRLNDLCIKDEIRKIKKS